MTKNQSLVFFAIALFALVIIVWFKTGSLAPPSGNDAIWFHAGIFTLLIGKFIVEYRFTRPNDVFVNCAIVFASISVLSSPPNAAWWEMLRWIAFIVGSGALFLSWDSRRERSLDASKWRTLVYRLLTGLGKADVIFSLVFVLALISYFDLDDPITRVLVVFWGGVLIASALQADQLLSLFRRTSPKNSATPIAAVHSFHTPNMLLARAFDRRTFEPRTIVTISSGNHDTPDHFGMITSNRRSPQTNLLVISLIDLDVRNLDASAGAVVCEVDNTADFEAIGIPAHFSNALVERFVGTVGPGTHIAQLQFEIFGRPALSAGVLLEVQSANTTTYFQIFDAEISEEPTVDQSARSYTIGRAEQLGIWDQERIGFVSHDWIAEERSLVVAIDDSSDVQSSDLSQREVSVGHIPHSRFPVVLDINDWVLFHSAILGVTGSGKSYLTFKIIEAAAAKGIKTVCVDPTGDYQRYLTTAVLTSGSEEIAAFLRSSEHMIAIVETAEGRGGHPIVKTLEVAKQCLAWRKENRTDDEVLTPTAKIQIVLEEAHLLIPEWNFNPNRGQQDTVSQIAQVVLQARKYGLGFLVVSQRTANVVKSVLNQCNTIVSFQAFDETGFDFLSNYMGQHHVRSLPNLKPRQGIVVGKASKSNRPVMARFDDQDRQIRTEPAQSMPTEPPSEVPNGNE